MPPQVALTSVRKAFAQSLDSSANLFAAVSPFLKKDYDAMLYNELHPEQARRVVALAFLAIVSAWEEFLGATFVRYLAGAKAPGGYAPTLRVGPAQSLQHAFQLVAGRTTADPSSYYLNWGVADTLDRAKLYLVGGAPFVPHIAPVRQRLDEAFIIRHRVAHSSIKARADFRKVAIRLTAPGKGKLRQGYSVGELLVSPATRGFRTSGGAPQSLFEAHLGLYSQLAARIVP